MLVIHPALVFAEEIAPPRSKAVVVALCEGMHWGVGAGLGALAGGVLYESRGAVFLFQACTGLSAVSMVLAAGTACYERRVTMELIDDDKQQETLSSEGARTMAHSVNEHII